jgi:hypothetical protein
MLKRILLPLILLASVPAIKATPILPADVTLEQAQKANKVMLWDIHNVVAQKEGGAKLSKAAIFFKTAPTWELVRAVVNMSLLKDIFSLPKSADASGEAYVTIFQRRNFPGLAAAVEQVSNAYKPREGMLELVQKLNDLGVTQRFASNIGPRLLANLNAKFKEKYNNNVLDLIKPGKVVSYNGQEGDHLATIGKPNPQFYKELNATYPEDLKVFVDDKLENAQGGVNAQWVGVHFDLKAKDPMTNLYKDLQALGFNIQQ